MIGGARRRFLRLLGAAPAAAAGLELHAKLASHNVVAIGGRELAAARLPSTRPLADGFSFTDFASWWERFGEAAARRQAREVTSFSADIVEMRLPLATKTRMQRARNLAHITEERRQWFAEQLSLDKVVRWWP